MRYAVIGTGWIAGSYIEGAAIAGNWELAAVCSRRRETGLKNAAISTHALREEGDSKSDGNPSGLQTT